MSNVVSVVLALFGNPGIQALLKEIMDMLGKKPAAAAQGMAADAPVHDQAHDQATVKKVVDEVVAKRVK